MSACVVDVSLSVANTCDMWRHVHRRVDTLYCVTKNKSVYMIYDICVRTTNNISQENREHMGHGNANGPGTHGSRKHGRLSEETFILMMLPSGGCLRLRAGRIEA